MNKGCVIKQTRWTVVVAILWLMGCGSDESPCKDGQKRCKLDNVEICSGGTWIHEKECPPDASCINGDCSWGVPSSVNVEDILIFDFNGCDDLQVDFAKFSGDLSSLNIKLGKPLTRDSSTGDVNCELFINLEIEEGWQYAVSSGSFSGRVYVQDGTVATVKSSFTPASYGTGLTRGFYREFSGTSGAHEDYTVSVTIDEAKESFLYSECTGDPSRVSAIRIGYNLTMPTQAADNYITIDSTAQVYGLKWKKCSL